MIPGTWLLRLARACCSADRCTRIVEPAIADFHYDVSRASRPADRLRTLASGYAAVTRTILGCVSADLSDDASRRFLRRAFGSYVAILAVSFAAEWLATQSPAAHAWLNRSAYLSWYARSWTATLVFATPLAMVPALSYARRTTPPHARVSAIAAFGAAVGITIAANGWIAPAIERSTTRDAPDRLSTSMSVVELVRAALSPLPHRFPGYPNYVAPEDRFAHAGFWRDLKFRASLVVIAAISATLAVSIRREPHGKNRRVRRVTQSNM